MWYSSSSIQHMIHTIMITTAPPLTTTIHYKSFEVLFIDLLSSRVRSQPAHRVRMEDAHSKVVGRWNRSVVFEWDLVCSSLRIYKYTVRIGPLGPLTPRNSVSTAAVCCTDRNFTTVTSLLPCSGCPFGISVSLSRITMYYSLVYVLAYHTAGIHH